MPGANCAFPGCHVSRTEKYKGIGVFQIPTRKDQFYSEWRKDIDHLNRQNLMKKYLKVTFIFVKGIMLKTILNSQVSSCIDKFLKYTSFQIIIKVKELATYIISYIFYKDF